MDYVRAEKLLGAEKVIVGNAHKDLILETLNKVYIKAGNKIEPLLAAVTAAMKSSVSEKLIITDLILDGFTYPGDGYFIYCTDNKYLYITVNGAAVALVQGGNINGSQYVMKTGDEMFGQLVMHTSKAPFIVLSRVLVERLNAEYHNGYSSDDFACVFEPEEITGDWKHQGTMTMNGLVTINAATIHNAPITTQSDIVTTGSIGTPMFMSGFSGYGWRMDGTTNTLTVDNLFVRKTMLVYEMVISRIMATNGSLWVTDANEVKEVEQVNLVILPTSIPSVAQLKDVICNALLRNAYHVFMTASQVLSMINAQTNANYDVEFSTSTMSLNAMTTISANGISGNKLLNNKGGLFVTFPSLLYVHDINKFRTHLKSKSFSDFDSLMRYLNPTTKSAIVNDSTTETNSSTKVTIGDNDELLSSVTEDNGSVLSIAFRTYATCDDSNSINIYDYTVLAKSPRFYAYLLSTINNNNGLSVFTSRSNPTPIYSYFKYYALRQSDFTRDLINNSSSDCKIVKAPRMYIVTMTSDNIPTFNPGDIVRTLKFSDNQVKYYDALVVLRIDAYTYLMIKAEGVFDTTTEIKYDEKGNVLDYNTRPSREVEAIEMTLELYESGSVDAYSTGITPKDHQVRVGHLSDVNRLNAVYITSSDLDSPYIDVMSGMNKPDASVLYLTPKYRTVNVRVLLSNGGYRRYDVYYVFVRDAVKMINAFNSIDLSLEYHVLNDPALVDKLVPDEQDIQFHNLVLSNLKVQDAEGEWSIVWTYNPTVVSTCEMYKVNDDTYHFMGTFSSPSKCRMGKLDGIVDPTFPADKQPYGYGLYADNVFLKGEFYLNNGDTVVNFAKNGVFMRYKEAGIEISSIPLAAYNPTIEQALVSCRPHNDWFVPQVLIKLDSLQSANRFFGVENNIGKTVFYNRYNIDNNIPFSSIGMKGGTYAWSANVPAKFTYYTNAEVNSYKEKLGVANLPSVELNANIYANLGVTTFYTIWAALGSLYLINAGPSKRLDLIDYPIYVRAYPVVMLDSEYERIILNADLIMYKTSDGTIGYLINSDGHLNDALFDFKDWGLEIEAAKGELKDLLDGVADNLDGLKDDLDKTQQVFVGDDRPDVLYKWGKTDNPDTYEDESMERHVGDLWKPLHDITYSYVANFPTGEENAYWKYYNSDNWKKNYEGAHKAYCEYTEGCFYTWLKVDLPTNSNEGLLCPYQWVLILDLEIIDSLLFIQNSRTRIFWGTWTKTTALKGNYTKSAFNTLKTTNPSLYNQLVTQLDEADKQLAIDFSSTNQGGPYKPYNTGDIWYKQAYETVNGLQVAKAGSYDTYFATATRLLEDGSMRWEDDWMKVTGDYSIIKDLVADWTNNFTDLSDDLEAFKEKTDMSQELWFTDDRPDVLYKWTNKDDASTSEDEDAKRHIGDMWFCKTTCTYFWYSNTWTKQNSSAPPPPGHDTTSVTTYTSSQVYVFGTTDVNNKRTYTWELVQDPDIVAAATAASNAQATADGKMTIFWGAWTTFKSSSDDVANRSTYTGPIIPYLKDDLWYKPDPSAPNDLTLVKVYKCTADRPVGSTTRLEADWKLYSRGLTMEDIINSESWKDLEDSLGGLITENDGRLQVWYTEHRPDLELNWGDSDNSATANVNEKREDHIGDIWVPTITSVYNKTSTRLYLYYGSTRVSYTISNGSVSYPGTTTTDSTYKSALQTAIVDITTKGSGSSASLYENGKVYIYTKKTGTSSNEDSLFGEYGWVCSGDEKLTQTLVDTAESAAVADGELNVFFGNWTSWVSDTTDLNNAGDKRKGPIKPYRIGDLWFRPDDSKGITVLHICGVNRLIGDGTSRYLSDWTTLNADSGIGGPLTLYESYTPPTFDLNWDEVTIDSLPKVIGNNGLFVFDNPSDLAALNTQLNSGAISKEEWATRAQAIASLYISNQGYLYGRNVSVSGNVVTWPSSTGELPNYGIVHPTFGTKELHSIQNMIESYIDIGATGPFIQLTEVNGETNLVGSGAGWGYYLLPHPQYNDTELVELFTFKPVPTINLCNINTLITCIDTTHTTMLEEFNRYLGTMYQLMYLNPGASNDIPCKMSGGNSVTDLFFSGMSSNLVNDSSGHIGFSSVTSKGVLYNGQVVQLIPLIASIICDGVSPQVHLDGAVDYPHAMGNVIERGSYIIIWTNSTSGSAVKIMNTNNYIDGDVYVDGRKLSSSDVSTLRTNGTVSLSGTKQHLIFIYRPTKIRNNAFQNITTINKVSLCRSSELGIYSTSDITTASLSSSMFSGSSVKYVALPEVSDFTVSGDLFSGLSGLTYYTNATFNTTQTGTKKTLDLRTADLMMCPYWFLLYGNNLTGFLLLYMYHMVALTATIHELNIRMYLANASLQYLNRNVFIINKTGYKCRLYWVRYTSWVDNSGGSRVTRYGYTISHQDLDLGEAISLTLKLVILSDNNNNKYGGFSWEPMEDNLREITNFNGLRNHSLYC